MAHRRVPLSLAHSVKAAITSAGSAPRAFASLASLGSSSGALAAEPTPLLGQGHLAHIPSHGAATGCASHLTTVRRVHRLSALAQARWHTAEHRPLPTILASWQKQQLRTIHLRVLSSAGGVWSGQERDQGRADSIGSHSSHHREMAESNQGDVAMGEATSTGREEELERRIAQLTSELEVRLCTVVSMWSCMCQ